MQHCELYIGRVKVQACKHDIQRFLMAMGREGYDAKLRIDAYIFIVIQSTIEVGAQKAQKTLHICS